MQGALLLLSKLQFLGQWRRLKRAVLTPKGIALTVVGIGFVAMIVVPRALAGAIPREVFNPLARSIFHPGVLFAFWLFTLVGSRVKSPLAFSMAEVEFLFAGPFSRRELLVHKLLVSTLGPLGLAILMPFAFPFVWWPAAFVGVLLMTSFMQWSAIAGALVAGWMGARFRTLRWVAAAALVAAALASFHQVGAFDPETDIRDRLLALESSWAARIVLAPFVVFNRVITAETAGTMLSWSVGALVMDLAVVIAILRLDRHFLEASLEASRRRFESLQRLARTGGASSFRVRSRPRLTFPRPPRLFGAGPIAWRQGLETLRGTGGPVLLVSTPLVIGILAMLVVAAIRRHDAPPTGVIMGVTLFVGLMITTTIPLGLRSELDHVDVVKTLPIGSRAIVFGSLASAIVYVMLVQAVAAAGTATVLGQWLPGVPLALALALPINVLSVAFDSVLVVLFPSIRRFVPGDLLVGMRMVLVSLAKIVFTMVAVGLASLPVVVAGVLFGWAVVPLAAVGCLTLLVEGLATAGIAAFLFERFDPSTDLDEGA
jgi:hypothetical protein